VDITLCQQFYESVAIAFSSSATKNNEPPHIHVKAESDQAKFWLEPISLASNYGFRAHELNEIERIVQEHKDELLEAWNERPS
jgi:hypothetical protein